MNCPHCQQAIDDATIKSHAAKLNASGCSDKKRAALIENAKKPRRYAPRPNRGKVE